MKTGMKAALAAVAWLAVGLGHAQEARVPVAAFATYNSMHSPQLSPDGRYLAVSSELEEGRHALRIYQLSDMTQTAMLRLPAFELPAKVRWVSDRRLIVAKGRKLGAREQPIATGDIIASDYDGSHQAYIFGYERNPKLRGLEPGFGSIAGLPEQPNGHFYMQRLSRNAQRSQLYDVDTDKATARLVADIPVRNLDFVLDRQGKPRYAYGTDDRDVYLLYAADAQGQWQPMSSKELGGKFVPVGFTPDGQQVYAGYSVNGGPSMLVRANPDGSQRQVLARDDFADFSDLEWTPRPWQPLAVTTGAGIPKQIYLDPTAAEAQLHEAVSNSFPGQVVSYINHSDDGDKSLLYVYSDRNAGAWYLFERKDRKISLLLVGREGLDAERMGERRPVRFQSSDGLTLTGFLTLPAGVSNPKRLPMVLLPHGGPHGVSDEWAFDTDAQFLASRGYLVLQVNFRGSGGRGAQFEQSGYRQWGTRMQDDLLDGVRWTIAQGYADPARICAYGSSFGAYSAMMVTAKAPELFKCAVGASGVYDLKMMLSKGDIDDTRWGQNYLERAIGSDDATLRANSPVSLAANIRVPVLLVHGEIDKRAPFAHAKAMKAALEASGNTPEWMAVPNEGHGFYKDANNIAFYERLQAFLERNIGAAAR